MVYEIFYWPGTTYTDLPWQPLVNFDLHKTDSISPLFDVGSSSHLLHPVKQNSKYSASVKKGILHKTAIGVIRDVSLSRTFYDYEQNINLSAISHLYFGLDALEGSTFIWNIYPASSNWNLYILV